MIAQNFEYSAPTQLDDALRALAGEDAKVLAGGMSLIPLMKLRLAAPAQLVDIGRIADLNFIHEEGGTLRIGATTTHYQVENSPLVRSKCPLLAEAASHIGDLQVRNMGTIGGSIAHADPAADYPASLLALEAKVSLVTAKSKREIPIADFFVDTFTTALEPGEIIRAVVVPVEDQSSRNQLPEKYPARFRFRHRRSRSPHPQVRRQDRHGPCRCHWLEWKAVPRHAS